MLDVAFTETSRGVVVRSKFRPLPSPDWSRDLVIDESDRSHWWSKFLGGEGLVTLATLGVGELAEAARGTVTMAEGSPAWAGKLVRQYADNVKGLNGFTDVFIHGTRDGKAFSVLHNGQHVILNHRQVAAWLKSQAVTGDIRLISCYAGQRPTGSVAQNLANKLGVTVRAPTDEIILLPDGRLTAPIGTIWRDLVPGIR